MDQGLASRGGRGNAARADVGVVGGWRCRTGHCCAPTPVGTR
jgi:hypothetical protein